jgi:RHS repeat-associated protein
MKYVDLLDSLNFDLGSPWKPTAFGIYPVWNERGQPVFGLAANGELKHCEGSACARVTWPEMWFAYERAKLRASGWQGTLLSDKQDAVGTHYRRNRYYDPSTGRFTQEDPIGLAGGLNVRSGWRRDCTCTGSRREIR